MEKETKQETLRRLFIENNLVKEDVFKHKFYTIITRAGIDKIQAANNIEISYKLLYNSDDTKCVIIIIWYPGYQIFIRIMIKIKIISKITIIIPATR